MKRKLKWISSRVEKPSYVLRLTPEQFYSEVFYKETEED